MSIFRKFQKHLQNSLKIFFNRNTSAYFKNIAVCNEPLISTKKKLDKQKYIASAKILKYLHEAKCTITQSVNLSKFGLDINHSNNF